eukprot:9562195-Alexandrium_andersonii.AAC.1
MSFCCSVSPPLARRLPAEAPPQVSAAAWRSRATCAWPLAAAMRVCIAPGAAAMRPGRPSLVGATRWPRERSPEACSVAAWAY